MDEDRPEDTLSPDSGRTRRAPPTIDLEASEVSGETQAAAGAASAGAGSQSKRSWPSTSAGGISAMATSAVTAADTAALVIAAACYLGWPGEPAAPPANTEAIDTLTS